MRVLLLYTPLTDPTAPYHSLTYLRSHAAAHGFTDVHIRDTNVEAFHHTLRPEQHRAVVARARRRRARLLSCPEPTAQDRRELALLLTAEVSDRQALLDAVATLQSAEDFYDYARYRAAVGRIEAWLGLLSTLGYPGQFRGFELRGAPQLDLSDTRTLRSESVLARVNAPFASYYDEVLLPEIEAAEYDLVGFNITYTAQLPFALRQAALLRERCPGTALVCGGTEVSDLWKYKASERTYDDLLTAFDASVIGEGESGFLALLRSRSRGGWPDDDSVRLAARHRRPGARRSSLALRVERLADLTTPDYGGLPWHLYLSPHRFVYFSPTRGCYWNKCTFCDYGLNGDGPTSPWRQDPVVRVVDQVAEISREARFVYFSVDVLAPAMMLRFAEAVVERGIDISWGAEIRLEKYWSPQKCEVLRRSGCVAVSVGFESGNDRVLKLIDKGVTVEQTRRTVHNLARAGIAVQMMGFTGFPDESAEEALDSVRFLSQVREDWTFGGLGSFDLTSGAIIAKEPERFGLRDVSPVPGTDIHRLLRYRHEVEWSDEEHARVRQGKRALQRAEFDRPWVGGTDTPHSYFYHRRYGLRVLDVIADRSGRHLTAPGRYLLNGHLAALPPGWTVDGFPATGTPAVRPTAPDEVAKVPFVRCDGAVFALPRVLAEKLRTYVAAPPSGAPESDGTGQEAAVADPGAGPTGAGAVPAWLARALEADILVRVAGPRAPEWLAVGAG
ncbi:B12-binding domain-containing radical SAM protein [Streptomyces odontomachi]|uniref:B12-binding domain-containing radical SAM protein n=1 Tax=Streptomyces odontomachi TaxID=2944940 RepID=UPI00272DF922|nr:radical SAM protein [Streptomyces sp. ODS25]